MGRQCARERRQYFLTRIISVLLCVPLFTVGIAVHALADDRSAERALYRDALADLHAVRLRAFEAKLERLEDYPLLPYLHYARLLRYISSTPPEAVVDFRERFADTPLADQALRHWLDNLARRGEWALYREHFDPDIAGGAGLQCRYYRALYETGDREAALAGAERMWLAGESRPRVCDPLFDAWRRAGRLTDALAWERLTLTLAANRPSLAVYLVRYLDADSKRLAHDFIALHRNPERLNRMNRLPGDPDRAAVVLAHTLKRLARNDPEMADAAQRTWAQRITLPAETERAVREEILRWSIRRDRLPENLYRHWPPRELAGNDNADLVVELARRAVAAEDWAQLLTWIGHLPEAKRERIGWRYWTARASLELNGTAGSIQALEPDAAEALLADVAGERNYYGFMAADRLGKPQQLNAEPLDLKPEEVAAIAAHPAMQRARELFATGEQADARRELAWLRGHLDERELLALAEFARRQGWHDQSIRATITAGEWNHLDLRFPLAFAEPMLSNAERRQLQPNWLFAVARQESAFMTDARSHAGALGVMQVMPATARSTARQLDIPLANNWQLLDHNKNIEIGSSYLAQMYERYERNRILASAAYNAGPGRVDQWLEQRRPTPADVWIEAIPFRETRSYVQNVLAFSLIYSHRLEIDQPFLHDHER